MFFRKLVSRNTSNDSTDTRNQNNNNQTTNPETPRTDFIKLSNICLNNQKDIEAYMKDINWVNYVGQGTYGQVWKVEKEDEIFAIKFMNTRKMSQDDKYLLRNEIAIWSTLKHPNVLTLQGIVHHDTTIYMITELMHESLYDRHVRFVRLGTKPRITTILKLLIEVTKAMVYLHDLDVLHRDIKSSNVLIKEDNIIKVADFGLSRYFSNNPMTAETGSYRWMAPEVIRHENYNHKCDVYSFAMLMYETVTLCVPFEKKSPIEVAFAVAKSQTRPNLPPLPEDITNLLQVCWDQDPQKRPEFSEIQSILCNIQKKKESYGSLQMMQREMSEGNFEKYVRE